MTSVQARPWLHMSEPQQRDQVGLLMWSAQLAEQVTLLLVAHDAYVEVKRITSKRRGAGCARRVMEDLVQWADERQCILGLTPTDELGADLARLTVFYRSLGFRGNVHRWRLRHIDTQMMRLPRPLAGSS